MEERSNTDVSTPFMEERSNTDEHTIHGREEHIIHGSENTDVSTSFS